ncbi:hypothetical protein PIB30_011180 [Stylosanthes scabra]|uniref:RRM domain-containing protein n=1 Tax=Stylosanthes scabra TaxID=79078 RepID=A0ABU6R618_9FABA|nr:hypothetical protein [Stylosanthes scabra]
MGNGDRRSRWLENPVEQEGKKQRSELDENGKKSLIRTYGQVYVSRKRRRSSSKPFAFIRFDSRGGAERVVQKINGTFVGTSKMMVKLANSQRYGKDGIGMTRHGRSDGNDKEVALHPGQHDQLEVSKGNEGGSSKDDVRNAGPKRKTIMATPDSTQVDLLKRNVVAESLNTIRFGWTKEQIAENWEGPGEVECRDLGPFKCILSFESVEARDIALESPCLHSIFFEIGKLWGKPVMVDELTDYYLSYTCASILIDSYEWEMIHEWVTLQDGEYNFETYVKEFGRKMHSAQAYPGVCHEESLCREASISLREGEERKGKMIVVVGTHQKSPWLRHGKLRG